MSPLKIYKSSNLKIFLSIFLSVFFLFLLSTTTALAQIPKPYVECNDVRPKSWPPSNWLENEFHSLRPYQASPCKIPIQEQELATLCGNDLQIKDVIHHPKDTHKCLDCEKVPPTCPAIVPRHFTAEREFIIAFNAYKSELPIAGNTELVPGGNPLSELIDKGFSKKQRLTYWQDHLPPDLNKYKNYQDYYVAYQRWRGKSCLRVPIPFLKKDIVLCWENPLNPNFWSKLFPNIPYSSTEDRIGKGHVDNMVYDGGSVDFIDGPNTIWNPPPGDVRRKKLANNETPLFFPHMEENVELTSLLQSTFLPPEIMEKKQEIGNVESVSPSKQCKILDVRYNPGDQLFGQTAGNLGVPNANVKYTAYYTCDVLYPAIPKTNACSSLYIELPCTPYTLFHSNVETSTPMVDELFAKTVSGNASVFKKIFPKIEDAAPIDKIKDIPASTSVLHQNEDVVSHTQLLSDPAEFYIPHFGSIYDYFLQDIQSMLRPKGFAAASAGLQKDKKIPEPDRLNEYLSWYLNGTLYRAENDPLAVNPNLIKRVLFGKDDDSDRIINYSGPLNKLLSQQSQWRNTFKFNSVSYNEKEAKQGKVNQIEKATKTRHDQIAGCILGIKIPFTKDKYILGFPVACKLAFVNSLPPDVPPGPGPGPGECPYSEVPSMTTNSSCQLSYGSINASQIPPLMKKVFEAAGAKNGVPPDLIAGVMFSEGGFEPRTVNSSCYGEPADQYTEEVIKNAVLCEFKNCNPNEYHPPCNYNSSDNMCGSTSSYGPYQQCPNDFNPCNFYDATMHAAAKLARDRHGLGSIEEYKNSGDGSTSCAGYNYNTSGISGSYGCSKGAWTCEDAVTALRFETGSCNEGHFSQALSIFGKCL